MAAETTKAAKSAKTSEHADRFGHEEWLAELQRRFGADPMHWAFRCPMCNDVATGQDFRDALAGQADRYASDHLGRECIGRVLGALEGAQKDWKGRGCDWAAFGLFRGPVLVTMADGTTVGAFRMAEATASGPA